MIMLIITVIDNREVTILWDMPIQTDREIKANRPDIVGNMSIKMTEKLSKCKDLEIEIEKFWGIKTTTIPVIIGALGLIKKEMEKYISKIPDNISIQEAQKCVLLGTAHILRRILSIK